MEVWEVMLNKGGKSNLFAAQHENRKKKGGGEKTPPFQTL